MNLVARRILPIIVFSQFCCTSLWFAGNGVMSDIILAFDLEKSALGHLTAAVQLGFISGTLIFALLTIADRFSPSKVFFVSALIGSFFNLGMIWEGHHFGGLVILRFFTGFFLAGIYPIGMKIAADYYDKGLGKSLGYLVGALVIGTAFPHLVRGFMESAPWRLVLMVTSALAVIGGVLMVVFVPDGPFRKAGQQLDFTALYTVFKNKEFRTAAFGYFGHMWELYAFWAFVPVMIATYDLLHADQAIPVSLWSFAIIGIGGVACILGGYLSMRWGPKRVAYTALSLSAAFCLLSPLLFRIQSPVIFLGLLMFWGMVVIADSPLFSTMVAGNADPERKGTALTIVNSMGFAITIISIQLLNYLVTVMNAEYIYLFLVIGPIIGLFNYIKS